jgi:hypothetical protein
MDGKMRQSIIEGEQLAVPGFRHYGDIIQGNLGNIASALLKIAGTRMVDQDLAHHAGAHSEEMRPVLPLRILPIHQAQVDFVNQGIRL